MPRWTQMEFDDFVLRSKSGKPPLVGVECTPRGGPEDTPEGEEEQLHNKIIEYCKFQKWLYIHSRMDKRTTLAPGTPDFLLYLPGGVHIMIECKTSKGKLSEEQTIFHGHARILGHYPQVVRSFNKFLEICHTAINLPTLLMPSPSSSTSEGSTTESPASPCTPSGS